MTIDERFNLQGKVAAVIGGAGFLCSTLARAMREAGMTVVTLDARRPTGAGRGREAVLHHLRCDVTSKASLARCRDAFLKRHGREPTLEELAGSAKIPSKEVGRLLELHRSSLSLDQPYGGGDEGYFGELIEDQKSETPVDASQQAMLRDSIQKLLKTLSYREREVLKLRYGLGDGYTYTLEEVGAIFKVSRERIRQIEVGALQKLQLPQRRDKLRGFWEEVSMQGG